MLALMGPSGCGKTTLLNYLSFRRSLIGLDKKKMNGQIFLNGVELTKNDRSKIAYVTQDIFLFPNITLFETLKFYANIKMNRNTSQREILMKIQEVTELMSLSNQLDTIIGDNTVRGLSGGERKRASVCVELLNDPNILFLDEPTSGLDSSMAMALMKMIQTLSVCKNTIVIASIHQPNSDLFHVFDRLLLLSDGKAAYFGRISDLKSHLTSLRLMCPLNWNMADHLLNILEGDSDILCSACKKSRLVLEYKEPKLHQVNTNKRKDRNSIGSFRANQLVANLIRSQLLTNYLTLNLANISYIVLTLLFTSIFWFKTPFTEEHIQSIYGLILFFGSIIYYEAMDINLYTFETDKLVLRHEMISKMYPLWMYYISKIITSVPYMLLSLCFEWTIIYFVTGLPLSAYFFLSLLQFFHLFLVVQALSLFIASLGLTPKSNMVVCDVIFTLSYVLGGYYNQNVSQWLKYIENISIFYQTFISQRTIYFIGYDGLGCSSNNSFFQDCIQGGSKVKYSDMKYSSSENLHPGYLILLQSVLLFLFHIIAFQLLKRTVKRPARSKFLLVELTKYFSLKVIEPLYRK